MANEHTADESVPERGDVKVVTTVTGPDQCRIVATAMFESAPVEVWALLWNWERLVAVGLPGLTSDFKWLSGGPDEVPSTFQFEVAGHTQRGDLRADGWSRNHTTTGPIATLTSFAIDTAPGAME